MDSVAATGTTSRSGSTSGSGMEGDDENTSDDRDDDEDEDDDDDDDDDEDGPAGEGGPTVGIFPAGGSARAGLARCIAEGEGTRAIGSGSRSEAGARAGDHSEPISGVEVGVGNAGGRCPIFIDAFAFGMVRSQSELELQLEELGVRVPPGGHAFRPAPPSSVWRRMLRNLLAHYRQESRFRDVCSVASMLLALSTISREQGGGPDGDGEAMQLRFLRCQAAAHSGQEALARRDLEAFQGEGLRVRVPAHVLASLRTVVRGESGVAGSARGQRIRARTLAVRAFVA